LFLLLQTFAKWLGFLQKLQVFPRAGHLLTCGKSPPQFLYFVSKNKDQRPRFKRTVNNVDNDNTKLCAKNDDSSSDDDYVFALIEAKVNNVKKGQSKILTVCITQFRDLT
jgi:hypothetical protein